MITVKQSDLDRAQLAALSVDPETLKDDGTDWSGKVVQKPWGQEYEVHRHLGSSVWRLDMLANSETSMHCHVSKSTILFVTEGEVEVSTLDSRFSLVKGGFVILEAGVFHRTSTIKGASLYELETPGNRNDLVRLRDKYGREGKGYACS